MFHDRVPFLTPFPPVWAFNAWSPDSELRYMLGARCLLIFREKIYILDIEYPINGNLKGSTPTTDQNTPRRDPVAQKQVW